MGRVLFAVYATILIGLLVIVAAGQPAVDRAADRDAVPFDADRAMAHLREMDRLGREGGGRMPGSPGHEAVSGYIERAFREQGLVTRVERFDDLFGGAMANIVAELPGADEESIVLGAHHDADAPGPAVVEGLAGVAVLLESARALRASKEAEAQAGIDGEAARTIVFVSWDGESAGCAGSERFAATSAADGRAPVRAVISLDSIGWSRGSPVLHCPRYYDRWGRGHIAPDWLVWSVVRSGASAGVSAPVGDPWLSVPYQAAVRLLDLGYYSDDRAFVLRGIPALFVSDFSLTHFYPHYGSGADTIEQVGREQLAEAGALVTSAVRDLAAAEPLPPGESEYLLVPGLHGWARLTSDHLRLLAALFVLPGLIGLGAVGGTIARSILVLYTAMAIAFLYGVLVIDPVVFSVVAGPAILVAPVLAVQSRRGVYGFCASLVSFSICIPLLLPLLTGGYDSRILLDGRGQGVLSVFCASAALLILVRFLSLPLPPRSAGRPTRPLLRTGDLG